MLFAYLRLAPAIFCNETIVRGMGPPRQKFTSPTFFLQDFLFAFDFQPRNQHLICASHLRVKFQTRDP